MTAYVALIRAVNVSGTGKLPKEELKAIGEACGFAQCRTYINSGNLLFASDLGEAEAIWDAFAGPVISEPAKNERGPPDDKTK